MKKHFIFALAAAVAMPIMAQTALDAYQLSRNDFRGTARYMSMGGAFGALGGDLSTLNNNPGGIGVYRKSEIGLTLDIDLQSTTSTSSIDKTKVSETNVGVNNVGYIGALFTNSDIMPVFNWGFSYSRVASFDRRYKGTIDMNGSLSNLIAGYTTAEGYTGDELAGTDDNYAWGNAPLLSMIGYNSYIINPVGGTNQYNGLWEDGKTSGDSDFDVEEKGYIDEYEITVGGNINNVVYWGLGVGITDILFSQSTYYGEFTDFAKLPVIQNGQPVSGAPAQIKDQNGNVLKSGFDLNSFKRITGSGVNVKFGLIAKPINELRIGFAVHTPTWYNLNQIEDASIRSYYGFEYDAKKGSYGDPTVVEAYSPYVPADGYSWKLKTPWRMIVSAAGVIGSKAIISADYEYRPYQDMSTKYRDGESCDLANSDIDSYYNAANIIRLGAEYRITPNFSVRAGYAYESTPTTTEVREAQTEVYTSPYDTKVPGLTPSYTLDNSTQYITCGLGYRYKNFYADAAYVHKSQESIFSPYSGANEYTENPMTAKIKGNNNKIVLSLGFKF